MARKGVKEYMRFLRIIFASESQFARPLCIVPCFLIHVDGALNQPKEGRPLCQFVTCS